MFFSILKNILPQYFFDKYYQSYVSFLDFVCADIKILGEKKPRSRLLELPERDLA